MARIRSIKPELPHDAKLATVSLPARYTFVLLWTVADDHGYFRASPRWLLGSLYPHDDIPAEQVEGWLAELVEVGVVTLLALPDGSPVGRVTNWTKHQRIDNASKSFICEQLGKAPKVAADRGESRQGSEESGEPPHPTARSLRALSPEPRVLSPEPGGRLPPTSELPGFDTLLEKLEEPYLDAVDGYIRAAQFPREVVATILAEGPDTGTNGAAGKTWPVIGQALVEMRAAGKPFTPIVFRAFIRRLLEAPPVRPGESPGDRARATADRLERQGAKK